MHEPKIFGLHIFCSISLRLREPVMVCSSFCSISPCPTAATHTSLSNYLGQQHQIIPTEIILKGGPKPLSHGPTLGWWPGCGQMQRECWEDRRKKNGCLEREARPQLISLEDPNSIKCAISDAAQAERSGLSVIILSAQLKASPCNINTKHTEYQFGKHTTITLFWSVFTKLYLSWFLKIKY